MSLSGGARDPFVGAAFEVAGGVSTEPFLGGTTAGGRGAPRIAIGLSGVLRAAAALLWSMRERRSSSFLAADSADESTGGVSASVTTGAPALREGDTARGEAGTREGEVGRGEARREGDGCRTGGARAGETDRGLASDAGAA